MAILRHFLAIALLPFVVVVLVPLWICRGNDLALHYGSSPVARALQLAGAALLMLGLVLFAASLRRFAIEGKGTLAPWDPPRRFVVGGTYRFVRNPMISGVIFLLCGEAMLLLSRWHAEWAAFVLGMNLVYIPVFEEPQLRRRFGASYEEYCRHVRRFIPRLTPWRPSA